MIQSFKWTEEQNRLETCLCSSIIHFIYSTHSPSRGCLQWTTVATLTCWFWFGGYIWSFKLSVHSFQFTIIVICIRCQEVWHDFMWKISRISSLSLISRTWIRIFQILHLTDIHSLTQYTQMLLTYKCTRRIYVDFLRYFPVLHKSDVISSH